METMDALRQIPDSLTEFMGKLGRKVARYPIVFIVVSILSALLFITGLQRLKYLTDFEELFVPHGARALEERNIVESYFDMDYQNYVPGHETKYANPGLFVIIKTKNTTQGHHHLHGLLNYGKMIDTALNKLVVTVGSKEEKNVTFENVCASTHFSGGKKCQSNGILDGIKIKYPKYTHSESKEPIYVPSFLGNVSLNGSYVEDASLLRLFYILDKEKENAIAWERAASSFMQNSHWEDESYSVLTIDSKSLERELTDNVHDALSKLPYTTGLLVCFMIMNAFILTGRTWNSKWNLIGLQTCLVFRSLIGLVLAVLGTLSGWGFVMYLDIRWQSTNLASLFLLLGVGMDDAFVMLNSWKRIKDIRPEESIEEKIQETYRDAAVSITITSMTNIFSFVIGIYVPSFEFVKIFCYYVTGGLVSIYILTLTFFGPFIVICNRVELYLIEKDKNNQANDEQDPNGENASNHRDTSQSNSGMNGVATNGQNNGQLVSSSNSKSWLMDRIIGYLIRFLQYEWIRVLIALVWIGFTSFCLVKIFQMKEGLEMNRTARYDSEIAMYFKAEDKYFGVMNRRIHLVITDHNLDFGDATGQDDILKLLDNINGLPLINGDEALREDWLSIYLDRRCKKRGKSSFKTNLLTCLRRYASKLPLRLNVKLSDDKSRIIATRFMFQSENITSAIMDMNLTKSLRQVADESSFNITVFSPIFPLVDQYLQVWSNTILSLGISLGVVLLITFLLIPNIKACILLSFTISSTILQVGGFMVLSDINLDVVSMIELIMCIGFSVDFCAHVCNHFYSSGGPQDTQDVNEEIKESLRAYGPPIVQGAISTILAVLPMCFLPSYILQSFTIMVMMVIGLGALHGLIVLPAIMGIVVRIQWEIKKFIIYF